MSEDLGRLPEVVAGLERGHVRLQHDRLVGELLVHPLERDVGRAAVHPADQTEREHVLGALRLLLGDVELPRRSHGDRRHRDLEHLEAVERPVLERVRLVPGLLDVARDEGVLVDDDGPPALETLEVRFERGRVHRDEDARMIARRQDLVGRELDLERRDAVHRSGRRADLRGEVGKRREVVAEDRRRVGESISGELHPVAGVTGEADDDAFLLLDGLDYHAARPDPVRRLLTS